MIVSVDPDGTLFFQSATSGCTGNGTVAPHLDGEFNVYDVELTLASCSGSYAYLNGVYEGLATTTPSSYWDYDSLLRAWLSKQEGSPAQAAVTLLARPLSGCRSPPTSALRDVHREPALRGLFVDR